MAEIVIAVPHAAVALPEGFEPPFASHVTPHFLRTQSDAFTDRVYSVAGVRAIKAEYSRFVVDPNRAPRQTSEGGVVPLTDFDELALYPPGGEPSEDQWRERVDRYHRPYHARVAAAVADRRTTFFIDGHSMAGIGPVRSPDRGRPRPDAVISNLGNFHGNPTPGTPFLTCPPPLTRWLGGRLSFWLTGVPAPPAGGRAEVTGTVQLNDPFKGGYGVRTHASLSHDLPGVQLELNQRLWTDEDTFVPLERRIPWIREVLRRWVEDIANRLRDEPRYASRAG